MRVEKTRRIKKEEEIKKEKERLEYMKETGLTFFRGDIVGFRRWQNSPAKHYDLTGHMGAVHSCKLSKCLKYLVSCSADKSVRLWKVDTGKCMLI